MDDRTDGFRGAIAMQALDAATAYVDFDIDCAVDPSRRSPADLHVVACLFSGHIHLDAIPDPAPGDMSVLMAWNELDDVVGAPSAMAVRSRAEPLRTLTYAQGEDVHRRLARDLAAIMTAAYSRSVAGREWLNETEVLIRRLQTLLEERERFVVALAEAYEDRDTANARADLLQTQLEALIAERYGVKESKVDPHILLGIAMLIATIVTPIAAVFVDHELNRPVSQVAEQADQVQGACNNYFFLGDANSGSAATPLVTADAPPSPSPSPPPAEPPPSPPVTPSPDDRARDLLVGVSPDVQAWARGSEPSHALLSAVRDILRIDGAPSRVEDALRSFSTEVTADRVGRLVRLVQQQQPARRPLPSPPRT
jgi:hypothetical protein